MNKKSDLTLLEQLTQKANDLDDFDERLATMYTYWLIDQSPSQESKDVVSSFVEWLMKESETDRNVKRGRHGLSYAQARKETNKKLSGVREEDPAGKVANVT